MSHPASSARRSDDVSAVGDRGDETWVDRPHEAVEGVARFGELAALGLLALLVGAVPFLALLGLVQTRWAPVETLDLRVADGLNAWLAANPGWLRPVEIASELGGGATATVVLSLVVAWLLLRSQARVAAYVAVTGIGLAVLVPVSKALVGRERPDVPVPLVELPTNASFPSGHAMTSLVTWGVLALVAWPLVRRRALLLAVTVTVVVLVGFTRLALGVHFVTDVLAGWALGIAWLAVTAAVFSGWLRWRHERLHAADEAAPYRSSLHLAPVPEPMLASGRRGWGLLAVAALGVAAVVTVFGLLVTRVLAGGPVEVWEAGVVQSLAGLRTETLTSAVTTVGRLAGLWGVVAVTVVAAGLALAHRGSWRPAVFVLLAVIGETAIYGLSSQLVNRPRPDVPDLTEGLPVGASFPSGHVAAATALYGAVALLVITYARSPWRWAVLVPVVLVVAATAAGRLYVAAHYPLDTVGGLLLGLAWLAVLARVVLGLPLSRTPPSWRAELHAPVVPSVPHPEPSAPSR